MIWSSVAPPLRWIIATTSALCVPSRGLPAAAFLVARFYTFDPYYLPTLRRMSDGGLVSPALVFAVAALALCAAAITSVRPQAGRFMAAPVILVSAFLALVADGGH